MPASPYFSFGVLIRGSASRCCTNPATFDIDAISQYVTTLEAAGYTLAVLADEPASLDDATLLYRPGLEAFTTAAYLASRTCSIGLAVSATTAYTEPFAQARLLASLDHVTHGRAAWLVQRTHSALLARHHQNPPRSHTVEQSRQREARTVVNRLWDTWEDDAFVRDKASGTFVNVEKIHSLDHHSDQFAVKGPLNVARPPQGHLPALGFTHRHDQHPPPVDIVFVTGLGATDSAASQWLVVVPCVADHLDDARAHAAAHLQTILLDEDEVFGGKPRSFWDAHPAVVPAEPTRPLGWRNVAALSQVCGQDLTTRALNADLAPHLMRTPQGEALYRSACRRREMLRTTKNDATRPLAGNTITLLELLQAFADPREVFAGTPEMWHAQVQTWSAATSGYRGLLISLPDSHVMQGDYARSLLPPDSVAATAPRRLRDRLGLSRPANLLVS